MNDVEQTNPADSEKTLDIFKKNIKALGIDLELQLSLLAEEARVDHEVRQILQRERITF